LNENVCTLIMNSTSLLLSLWIIENTVLKETFEDKSPNKM